MNKHTIGFTIRAIGVIALLLLPLLLLLGCGTAKSSAEWGADGSYKVASSGRSVMSSTAAKNLQSQQSITPEGAYNREFGAEDINTKPDSESISVVAGAITEGAVRGAVAAITGNVGALIPSSPTPRSSPPPAWLEPVARNPPAIADDPDPDLATPPADSPSP